MTVVLTVALTAVVIGTVAALLVPRAVRTRITRAIGGRDGFDPVDEHRRMLSEATQGTVAATARAELLAEALGALSAGVIVADLAGREVLRNRLAADISPRSHEKTLVNVAAAELLAEAVRGQESEREVEVFGPPPRTLALHAVPIAIGTDALGALVMIDDITDHRRVEKTRRDFIANLSHELRTPVGAVSLLAEMLLDEELPENRAQLTTRMLVETERMTETINDLLELSRIESNTETYTDIIVVQDLLDDAVERTRVQAETRGISIGVIAPHDPISLRGNAAQLATALVNLVENAVKYSSSGDSVSLRARLDDGQVALVVQDTGRGIPARDRDRIFERFYRVDRSRDATTGGTGIGLSIVRHVALNHGGTVAVESYEGEGSTFTLTVPVLQLGQTVTSASTSNDSHVDTADEAS